jgi:hypothetical protein
MCQRHRSRFPSFSHSPIITTRCDVSCTSSVLLLLLLLLPPNLQAGDTLLLSDVQPARRSLPCGASLASPRIPASREIISAHWWELSGPPWNVRRRIISRVVVIIGIR